MNCDILKQRMMGVFQQDNDPQAHFQEAEGKGVALAKMSPDLNLLKHLWGILK